LKLPDVSPAASRNFDLMMKDAQNFEDEIKSRIIPPDKYQKYVLEFVANVDFPIQTAPEQILSLATKRMVFNEVVEWFGLLLQVRNIHAACNLNGNVNFTIVILHPGQQSKYQWIC
jgi:hypothetical protein